MKKLEKNKIVMETREMSGLKFDPYFLIILFLALAIPLFILPNILENVFERPKTLLLIGGASLLMGLYVIRFLRGKSVPVAASEIPKILILLLILNGLNFFYTKNYYYTCLAAALHLSSLIIFYIVSLQLDRKKAFWILVAAALSGFFVAMVSWLQFFNIFLLYKGRPGMMIIGTIGNSNHLGAYLLFPLFILSGLFFLVKNRTRYLIGLVFLFIFTAFLFSRARASWLSFGPAFLIFIFIVFKIYHLSPWAYFKSHIKNSIFMILMLAILLPAFWVVMPQRLHDTLSPANIFESETLRLRVTKYWPPAFWLINQNKQALLFGNGFWSYRNMVYTAQAEINKKNEGFFKDYPDPKPREAHNDLIEVFNEGGIVLSLALGLFLLVVLRHGWLVIRDEKLELETRLITATAFSAIIAIMGSCFFFFPFRVNTTMFMAALMAGIVENMYLINFNLIRSNSVGKTRSNPILILLVCLIMIGFAWLTAVKPLLGEKELLKFKKYRFMGEYHFAQKNYQTAQEEMKQAKQHIDNALKYDPLNTTFNLEACLFHVSIFPDYPKANDYLETAINHFNGDIVEWSLYDIKGRLKLQVGSLEEAKIAFERSLYINPEFEKARMGLAVAEKALAEKANQSNSSINN